MPRARVGTILDAYGQPIVRTVPPRGPCATYDVVQTTTDNKRYWAPADALSASASVSPAVRATARKRARYETANNSFARGIVLTLANDTVGTGPRLQMQTGIPELDSRIERAFGAWSTAADLAAKLRLARVARAVDGEAVLVLGINPRRQSGVQLDVTVVECDRLTTPDAWNYQSANWVDGIVFDENNNPVEYHILRYHPGDLTIRSALLAYDKLPAASVIHYFRQDRPGQYRGLPDLLPALSIFGELRRYTQAVISAAETAADYAAVMKTTLPPSEEPDPTGDLPFIELERRMIVPLPDGWEMQQLRSEQPSTTHTDFVKSAINEAARCLNMPLNVAMANSADYNYASGRLDHQTYFKSIYVERNDIEHRIMDRIFTAWIDEAVLVDGFLPQSARLRTAEFPHEWFWDGFEHVDPMKEARADMVRMSAGLLTFPEYFGRRGRDWEREQEAQALALGVSLTEYRALLRQKLFGPPEPSDPDLMTDVAEDASANER